MEVLPQIGISSKKPDIIPLDLRDKKILFMLSQNARSPLSKIAKFANLSRDSVKYRINNYEKKDLLKQSVTIVNAAKLGYDSYHIFLRLNNPSKEAEAKIITEISNMPFVRAVLKLFGNYDFEIAVIAKNVSEFDGILTKIISATKNFIQDYEILIIVDNYKSGSFPNKFLEDIHSDVIHFKPERAKKGDYIPDKKDFEIIKTIRNNAELSLIDISSKVKLSPDAVGYRLKKLKENIIIAFIPVINYQAIGYNVNVLLLNISSLDKENEKKLIDFIRKDPNILWSVKTVGRFNLLAYICSQKETEIQDTINNLRSHFPEIINRYELLPAFEEYKYTYAPDCIFEDTKR